jgi:predicted nucleotidyltransferase
LALVRRAAEALKARFNVRRVLLFGSLAHEAWYASDSDVDLAVQGLSAHDYWRAWGVIEDIITERSVDLVDLDAAPASLRRSIERDGVEL